MSVYNQVILDRKLNDPSSDYEPYKTQNTIKQLTRNSRASTLTTKTKKELCDDLSKVSPQVLDEAPVEAVYAKVMFFRNVETPVNKTFNISIKLPTKNLKQLDEFKLELKMKHSGQMKQKESLSRFTDLYNNY